MGTHIAGLDTLTHSWGLQLPSSTKKCIQLNTYKLKQYAMPPLTDHTPHTLQKIDSWHTSPILRPPTTLVKIYSYFLLLIKSSVRTWLSLLYPSVQNTLRRVVHNE